MKIHVPSALLNKSPDESPLAIDEESDPNVKHVKAD